MSTEQYKNGYLHIVLTKDEIEKSIAMMLEQINSSSVSKRKQLTPEEYHKAMYLARERRHYNIQNEQYWQRVRTLGNDIPKLTWRQLGDKVLADFAKKYQREFIIDETNEPQFKLLCMYFSGDTTFENATTRNKAGEKVSAGFSLKKGILLMGPKGTGKTSLMKMFRVNPHACFSVKSALTITQAYRDQKDSEKADVLEYYSKTIKQPVNANIFRQSELGICFDDIGREDESNKYGNYLNVIAYLISTRYEYEVPFKYTHYTTNISSETIEKLYGTRTRDIFRETVNQITFSPRLPSRR